jgi:hypothetical protein
MYVSMYISMDVSAMKHPTDGGVGMKCRTGTSSVTTHPAGADYQPDTV